MSVSQTLMGAEDHIGADGRGILARKFALEGDHAIRLQTAIQHHVKPLLAIERTRVAQIREDAAADRYVAMARSAGALV